MSTPGRPPASHPPGPRSRLIESLTTDLHDLYFWQTNDRVRLDMDALRACVRAALDDHSSYAVVARADPRSEAVRLGTPWVLAVLPGARRRAIRSSSEPLLLWVLKTSPSASYEYFATHREAITAASARTSELRHRTSAPRPR